MRKFKLNGVNYSFYNSEISVEQMQTGYEGDIIIPRFVVFEDKEYEVTQIGWYAFFRCKKLKRLVLPESIKHIGNRAFDGCDNLEKLILNMENPPSIDNYTFGKNKPKIIVPFASIEAYTKHENWKNFTINTISKFILPSKTIEPLHKNEPSYEIEEPIKRAKKWIEEEKTRKSLVEKIETLQHKIDFDSPKNENTSNEKISEILTKEVVLIRELLEQQLNEKLHKLYTVREFADYLDVNTQDAYKIIKNHNIKVLAISEHNTMIEESEITKYIKSIRNK